jgi:protein disulfide-isomerase-like protein
MVKSNYKQIMKMLRIKKLQSAIKKLQKKFFFLIKPKNLYKVLFLLAILGLLYFIRQKFLVKEGMACEAEDFEDKINGKKAMVLFHAPWCGHCKNFMPEWDQISSEAESKLDESTTVVLKVDCGDSQNNSTHAEIMEKYGIKGYPTIMTFDETGNHVEYEGERNKAGIFGFFGINDSDSEGFTEGMGCEDYFEIELLEKANEGSHVLVFSPDNSGNFTALGGERPVLDDYIVKGNEITDVATTPETDGAYKITLQTKLTNQGKISAYGGNKFHVITDNNTNEVSGNELCKGFVHAEWEKDPEGGDDFFYVNEKDASVLSKGMYLAEGYGVEMPPHVYRSYVTSDGSQLRVVIANGQTNESAINEASGATVAPKVIPQDIPATTKIKFIKPSKSWTSNPYDPEGKGKANNGGTAVTG